jgi:hypothetical protein
MIRILFVLALFVIGCSSKTEKPVVAVEGKITFEDGSPLPIGTRVVFNPSEGKVGTSTGITDASGSFKLVHVSGSSGAEVGKYNIMLLAPEDGNTAAFYKQVPRDYYEGGVLTTEIKQGTSIVLKIPRSKK